MIPDFDAYIICATPRTGSTLLCDLLTSTGNAGAPDSFFGRRHIGWWAEQWGLPPADEIAEPAFCRVYLDAAIRAGRGETEVFGLRLMRENISDLNRFVEQVHPGIQTDRARIEAAFGKVLYLHLSRDDKLAQAVSLVKAEQTGLWHIAPDGTEVERLGPPAEPVYDFQRLQRELAELGAHDAAWLSWFDSQGIQPLRITYETLSADPAASLSSICLALGIDPPPADAIKPGVAKLADAVSQEWIARYRRDASAQA